MKFAVSLWLSCLTAAASLSAATFEAAESANALGLDLYRHLSTETKPGNLVISPYSIQSALALAYSGAEGETRSEMSRVLRLPSGNESLATGFARLRESLALAVSRSREMAAGQRDEGETTPIELHTASRIYGQQGDGFRDAHLAFLQDRFLAPFESVDFQTNPEVARNQINQWIAAQTQERIKDIISPGALSLDSRLVLVNALYFKAAWMKPFQTRLTTARPFHLADGSTREVPMMEHLDYMGYAHGNRRTAVALSYIDSRLQFLIILPDSDVSLAEMAASLNATHFSQWAKLPAAEVILQLPKFRESAPPISLKDALIALGLRQAFDLPAGSADFGRLAPRSASGPLAISNVIHKTFIAVDEKGTEAAAATAIAMMRGRGPTGRKAVIVRVDRPFLFAIQDRRTGLCLFLGRIDDPRW